MGCADAVPRTQYPSILGKGRAVCGESCKHGSREGGTGDPVKDNRPLLYLPPLLQALYAEVANGGVGPVEGIMGAIGGFEDNHGTIVDAYLEKKEHYRLVDLAACEQWAKPYTGPMRPHKVVSHLYVELPRDVWPERLLEFYNHGCGTFSCIDADTDRFFGLMMTMSSFTKPTR